MMPEMTEYGVVSAQANLLWMLAISVLLLVGAGHALLRWRQFRDGPMRTEARPYRGWVMAFLILLACFQLSLASYWQRAAVGTVVEANVEEVVTTEHRGRIRTYSYTVVAMSVNAERWHLQDDAASGWSATALKARLDANNGPVRVPFVVVPSSPQNHQLGSRATAHGGVLLAATLVLLVLFPTYAIEAPRLRPAHGQLFDTFSDNLAGLGGAASDQLAELTAILSAALLTVGRLRGESLTWLDMLCLLAFVTCLWLSLRNALRPRPRTLTIEEKVTFALPSSSAFHFVFDALWVAIGGMLWLYMRRYDIGMALGASFIAIPAVLLIARALCWQRRCP